MPSPCRITSVHSVLQHIADTRPFFFKTENTFCTKHPLLLLPSIHPVFFDYCYAYNLSRCQDLVRHEQACKQCCSADDMWASPQNCGKRPVGVPQFDGETGKDECRNLMLTRWHFLLMSLHQFLHSFVQTPQNS